MEYFSSQRRAASIVLSSLILLFAYLATGFSQWTRPGSDTENPAIAYSTSVTSDAVARLQRDLEQGKTEIEFDATAGYLPGVLRELKVRVASQTLVFSKTSFQRPLISPENPRAIYFNDDVYVGWVRGADTFEVASIDAVLGPIFYTVRQDRNTRPVFQRKTAECLQCHDSLTFTDAVPGLLMKSVYPDQTGEPIMSSGIFMTTDQSPFQERWGGWYVSGRSGHDHMGADLNERIDTSAFPTGTSDIVALMVLAHQNKVHNLITRATYRTRMALDFDQKRNQALGRDKDFISESTSNVAKVAAEELVRALLFVDEAPLASPVSGLSDFTQAFTKSGLRDKKGRSLRQFDLTHRLFRYPCSYLIYSDHFNALPAITKNYVNQRLRQVLSGEDNSKTFSHLSHDDRTAILEILLETKPDFVNRRP